MGKVVAICHSRPDGDAIGSLLGWHWICQSYGIDSLPMCPDPIPDYLGFLPGTESLFVFNPTDQNPAELLLNEAGLIVLLDFSRRNRCGDELSALLAKANCPVWCIDHHPEPESFDALFHDTSASSTCELVVRLTSEPCTPQAAMCLMTGLLTDTGRFQFATSPATFQAASILLNSDMDYRALTDRLFEQESLQALRLRGHILKDKLIQSPDLPMAWIELSFQDSKSLNLKSGATEGWVNFGLAIEGNQAAFLLHEKEEGITRISFRSKNQVEVNRFAEKYFQGGGHKYAAGGCFEGNSAAALQFLLERVHELF